MQPDLSRFLNAQNHTYRHALEEVRSGKKTSHWMWYIFPQLRGLGHSETAQLFAIRDLKEARAYLDHPVLGPNLIEISTELLQLKDKSAREIFGATDELKLRSCMTLFAGIENSDPIFEKVLDKYFDGTKDPLTLQLLEGSSS